ncbi:unnamed protein product [Trichogramma brassicae]|uniref:MI domain-containing protein n=1 Tax=Trichogramma brassicae TaxID=86971 RepID=A0A6H5I819_9HYME|nr:unnamed protein product [Trichogramma brassicae]
MSGVEKKSDNNKKRHRKSSSLRKHRKRHRSTSSETNDIRYERSGSIGEKEIRHRRSSSSDNSEKRNERSGSTGEKERRHRRSSSSNTSEKRNERSKSMDRNKKRHERSTLSDTNKKKYERSKSKNENEKRHERSRSINRNQKEHTRSSSDTSEEKHERSGSVEKTKKRHKTSGSKDKNNKRHRRSSSSDSNDKRYGRSGSMDKNKKRHKRQGSISRNEKRYKKNESIDKHDKRYKRSSSSDTNDKRYERSKSIDKNEKRYKRRGSTSRNEKRYKRNGSTDKNDKKHRRSISSDTNDKRYERSRSIDENNQRHKRNESLGRNDKRSEGSRPKDENDKRYERRGTIDRNERRYKRSTSIEANEKICKRSRSRDHDENRYTTNSSVDRKDGMSNVNKIGYENLGPKPIQKEELLTTKTGGAYIPPAKLRLMQAELKDKSSSAYQRIAWEALKKSIHGFINKVNTSNIGPITRDLLKENIVRGRGLLARSIIQAQAASPTFTPVYAALVAVINSKFPNIGELIVKRLAIQFKRGFKRNSKVLCISSATFIAHLVNQGVAHEILILEILTLLVQTPTDDSIEIAIAILKEVGMKLTQVCRKGIEAIFEMLRNILHEGHLDKRVQYMIEVVFQIRKDGFKDHEAVNKDLDLVEEEDQMTHLIALDEATDSQDILNVFKFDAEYLTNEEKYKELSKDILNSDSDDDDDDEGSDEEDDEDEDEEDEKTESGGLIIDNTETNLTALRRTIYLTIHSSLDFEECAHKLLKMQLKPGQEMELCHMFLDCCAEMRTYEKFFGLLAGRFCAINRIYVGPFEEIFRTSYNTIHRLDTNRLRNVAKFFAHLLMTDSISWAVLSEIKLNEDDTTSSSRVFIKILFQELSEYMGLPKLNDKLKDEEMQEAFNGLFPKDDPRNTRFAINFFTSIGLGGLTDDLREFLKNRPKKDVPKRRSIYARVKTPSPKLLDTVLVNSSDESSSESSPNKPNILIDESKEEASIKNKSTAAKNIIVQSKKKVAKRKLLKENSDLVSFSPAEEDLEDRKVTPKPPTRRRNNLRKKMIEKKIKLIENKKVEDKKETKKIKNTKTNQIENQNDTNVERDEVNDVENNQYNEPMKSNKKYKKIKSKKFIVKKGNIKNPLEDLLEEPQSSTSNERSSLREFDLKNLKRQNVEDTQRPKNHKIVIVMTGLPKE